MRGTRSGRTEASYRDLSLQCCVEIFIASFSNIDPDTIKAYLETHYCVGGGLPMTLRIDVKALPW